MLDGNIRYSADEIKEIRKIQRSYFDVQVSPLIKEIMHRIAVHRPDDVKDFTCRQLRSMIESHSLF